MGRVGGHPAYFLCVCMRDGVQGRGYTLGAVVESEGNKRLSEVHGRSDFVSGKGAATIGIWQA